MKWLRTNGKRIKSRCTPDIYDINSVVKYRKPWFSHCELFEFHAHYLLGHIFYTYMCVWAASIDLYLHFIVFVHPQTVKRAKWNAFVHFRAANNAVSLFFIFDRISKNVIISVENWWSLKRARESGRNFIISLRWLKSKTSRYPLCVCERGRLCSFVKNCDWVPVPTDTWYTRKRWAMNGKNAMEWAWVIVGEGRKNSIRRPICCCCYNRIVLIYLSLTTCSHLLCVIE